MQSRTFFSLKIAGLVAKTIDKKFCRLGASVGAILKANVDHLLVD